MPKLDQQCAEGAVPAAGHGGGRLGTLAAVTMRATKLPHQSLQWKAMSAAGSRWKTCSLHVQLSWYNDTSCPNLCGRVAKSSLHMELSCRDEGVRH